MPKPTLPDQIEKWESLPVIVTGKPNAHALEVIMQSIENFVVAGIVSDQLEVEPA